LKERLLNTGATISVFVGFGINAGALKQADAPVIPKDTYVPVALMDRGKRGIPLWPVESTTGNRYLHALNR